MNQVESIGTINNLMAYFDSQNSNKNNLDNLLKVKRVLIKLTKGISNSLKTNIKDFNKKIDNNVLTILTDKINEILGEYLNYLPNTLEDAKKDDSISNTKNMIQKIYDELSKYYIDLEDCYNLNLKKINPTLKSEMDNYLVIYNKNKKILNQTNDYYKLMGYDKCEIRILQNIRCCMRVIVFLSVNFNYNDYFGSFGESRFRVLKLPKQYVWSKQQYKSRNVIKSEFLNVLSRKYSDSDITESSISNFDTLRKIIGCDYYWTNNNTKKKLINGDCKNDVVKINNNKPNNKPNNKVM